MDTGPGAVGLSRRGYPHGISSTGYPHRISSGDIIAEYAISLEVFGVVLGAVGPQIVAHSAVGRSFSDLLAVGQSFSDVLWP